MKRYILMLSLVITLFFPVKIFTQSANIQIPLYEQGNESPWAEELLGNKSELTIRTHGCALTCISMITSHFSNNQITPSKMNKWLKTNSGFQDGWEGDTYLGEVNLNWPVLSRFEKGYVYTRHNWKTQPADLVLIKYYLDNKVPVIGEVLYRGAPHYIVITGYDEDDFYMNDPETPEKHKF